MNFEIVGKKATANEKDTKDYGVIIPEWTLNEVVLSPKVEDSIIFALSRYEYIKQ